MIRSSFLFTLLLLSASACETTKPPVENPSTGYHKGVLVCNEGIFSQTSGTISFFDPLKGEVSQDIFKKVNNRDLGNVVQSLHVWNRRVYIVVNNSNKIEIAEDSSFKEIAQITGFAQPRYFLPLNANTAYVSQWGADGLTGSIQVLDLQTNTIRQSVNLFKGSERMFLINGKVWVLHAGGYDHDTRIAIINPSTHQLEQTINLPTHNPNSLVLAANGNVWVACAGKTVYSSYPNIDENQSTSPMLVCIRPSDMQVLQTVAFAKGAPVQHLIAPPNPEKAYFYQQNKLYSLNLQTGAYTPLNGSAANANLYGFAADWSRGQLYAARYQGIAPATILRMNLEGELVDSFKAGVFANGFWIP